VQRRCCCCCCWCWWYWCRSFGFSYCT